MSAVVLWGGIALIVAGVAGFALYTCRWLLDLTQRIDHDARTLAAAARDIIAARDAQTRAADALDEMAGILTRLNKPADPPARGRHASTYTRPAVPTSATRNRDTVTTDGNGPAPDGAGAGPQDPTTPTQKGSRP